MQSISTIGLAATDRGTAGSITRQYSGYMLMPFLHHGDDDEVDGDDVDDDGVEKSAQHCQGW